MPPFPVQYSPLGSRQSQSSLESRSSSPSVDETETTNMAYSILKPRASVDVLSPALAPLEPLSTFAETNPSTHLLDTFSKRDVSEQSDSSVHEFASRALQTGAIPNSYNLSGAKPGIVVGATLGAVAGVIFLFWLISLLMGAQGMGFIEGSDVTDVHVHRRAYSEPRSRRTRRTRTHRSDMSERSSPPRRRERILVEETRRTERSRPPPPEEPLSPEVEREHVEVEEREAERRVEGDDVVEVIEEQSDITPDPPRRKKSGYRPVDPDQYGGGNYAQREVYENDRRRRRHR